MKKPLSDVEIGSLSSPAFTDNHIAAYPPEYLAGIELFNAREFHAAHDAWEERWLGPVGPQEKLFLQALIQSAVVFHHLELGRQGAARKMREMAEEKFVRLGSKVFMSLDIDDFRRRVGASLEWLLDQNDPRTMADADLELPMIILVPGIMEFD